jgi:hypothetical protein
MSLLPHDTFVNASRQLYADLGSGGGGGSTSSLQSPATVIPDALGNISMSLLTPDGDSQLTVRAQGVSDTASLFVKSDNGNAVLTIDASGGGGASLIMNGSDGQAFVTMNQSSATPSVFTMFAAPAQVGQTAFLNYNAAAGTLALGDGLPTGAVSTNQPLTVGPNAGGLSSVGIGGGTTSVLSLQAINLFASSAANRTMVINASTDGSDVPLAAFDYTNDIIALGKPLFGGTITLNSPVVITDPITGQATYQQVIGTVAAATPITITNPTQNGLYSVMMTTSAGDVVSQQACIGVVAYWRNGVGWTAGGNVSTPLNALGNQYAQLLTGGGNGAMQFQTAATTPTLNGMGCSVVQLTGSIPSF